MSKRSIIRKRTVCFFACAALLLVGVLLAWILWPRAAAQTRAQAYREGLDTYRYDLVFRPEQSTLAVTLTLDYTNRTGDTLQELVLRKAQEDGTDLTTNPIFTPTGVKTSRNEAVAPSGRPR